MRGRASLLLEGTLLSAAAAESLPRSNLFGGNVPRVGPPLARDAFPAERGRGHRGLGARIEFGPPPTASKTPWTRPAPLSGVSKTRGWRGASAQVDGEIYHPSRPSLEACDRLEPHRSPMLEPTERKIENSPEDGWRKRRQGELAAVRGGRGIGPRGRGRLLGDGRRG
ncbi:hypothetical protein KM043_003841 [Ampulex compressa]|nr:hypothetical protein KM043_003841 [Ampulex compressa]